MRVRVRVRVRVRLGVRVRGTARVRVNVMAASLVMVKDVVASAAPHSWYRDDRRWRAEPPTFDEQRNQVVFNRGVDGHTAKLCRLAAAGKSYRP